MANLIDARYFLTFFSRGAVAVVDFYTSAVLVLVLALAPSGRVREKGTSQPFILCERISTGTLPSNTPSYAISRILLSSLSQRLVQRYVVMYTRAPQQHRDAARAFLRSFSFYFTCVQTPPQPPTKHESSFVSTAAHRFF